MHRLTILLAMLLAFTGFALAEDFNGKLIDATCHSQEKGAKPCDATATTSSFAVNVDGQVYNLDAAGNTKAAEALKSRADRSTDPSRATTGAVMARITGTKEGQTIKVQNIEVR
jgi:hypothetical protein